MPSKIYWIHTFDNSARIGIMARPRGDDWLEDEISSIKNNQVGVLVSLLERDEIYDLELAFEKELCEKKDIIYTNFPIPDRGIPKQNDNTDQLIDTLPKQLNNGLSVVVHCRMGIGRSSIIVAQWLISFPKKSLITLIIVKTRLASYPEYLIKFFHNWSRIASGRFKFAPISGF